jgi:acetamidase/formamidase
VHWGYFSHALRPVLAVNSDDIVTIETLTQHAYDDHDRMIKGDPGAESVFHWCADHKNVDRRGAGPLDASIYGRGAGEGFGVHICTGPIAVAGAMPGDLIEVRILDLRTRPSANPAYLGRTFGSNAATWWGYHYRELLTDPRPREVVTIYELGRGDGGEIAKAVYSFRWRPQTDPFGVVHPTIDYPGIPVDHATVHRRTDILKGVEIPVRPHFGVIGLAPSEADIVDSIPPNSYGGNMDNWRAGKGARVYLPVAVEGGLLSVGDPHASQGDSELCGTAIECSLTGEADNDRPPRHGYYFTYSSTNHILAGMIAAKGPVGPTATSSVRWSSMRSSWSAGSRPKLPHRAGPKYLMRLMRGRILGDRYWLQLCKERRGVGRRAPGSG